MLHQTRLHDILWQRAFSQQILTRSRGDQRHHRDDTPSDKTGATIILGTVNYLQTFIPHLSHHTEPLYALLKKENSFTWDENSNTSFRELNPYWRKHSWNPSGTTTETNQSPSSVTLHSRDSELALSKMAIPELLQASLSQTQYANIEREFLAIVYCCEEFHLPVWKNIYRWNRPQTAGDDK